MIYPQITYNPLFFTSFMEGISPVKSQLGEFVIHALPGDINIVADPLGGDDRVLKCEIYFDKDYTSLLTGTPRCACSLNITYETYYPTTNEAALLQGNDYIMQLSTFMAADEQIETNKLNYPLIFEFAHPETGTQESSTFCVAAGEQYKVWSRTNKPGENSFTTMFYFGNPAADRGRWVNWILRYRPDPYLAGIIELWKDGVCVWSYRGRTAGKDEMYYPVLQLYKSNWHLLDTNTDYHCIYYKNVLLQHVANF